MPARRSRHRTARSGPPSTRRPLVRHGGAPGEVVVSDTVRALTRSVGTCRLRARWDATPIKGLDESLSCIAPSRRSHGPSAERGADRRRALGGLAAAAAIGGHRRRSPLIERLRRPDHRRPGPRASRGPARRRHRTIRPRLRRPTVALSGVLRRPSKFAVPVDDRRSGPGGAVGFDQPDLVAFASRLRRPDRLDRCHPRGGDVLDPPCLTSTPGVPRRRNGRTSSTGYRPPWLDHGDPRPYNVGRLPRPSRRHRRPGPPIAGLPG